WKKKTTNVNGYQVQCATNKKFTKNKKSVNITKNATTKTTIKKLKGGKKYYIRIRTYKKINGKKYYGPWSKAKTVTTKK
ncbi:MAG: fibronectin type III domain-containing protein, partial [Eubacterium sp.]|nr:fibronectin type III domain-containing protein [Eubacterium sp.]